MLEAGAGATEEVIFRCAAIKADIVRRDEREAGERKLLNFGHTVGHAIENIAGYGRYGHGQAVSIGMSAITRNGEREGITRPGTSERLDALLTRLGLPLAAEGVGTARILEAAAFDKKAAGDSIDLVLLRRIGEAFVRNVDVHDRGRFFQGAGTGEAGT
jgi:3-dehydroquinate synthase